MASECSVGGGGRLLAGFEVGEIGLRADRVDWGDLADRGEYPEQTVGACGRDEGSGTRWASGCSYIWRWDCSSESGCRGVGSGRGGGILPLRVSLPDAELGLLADRVDCDCQ